MPLYIPGILYCLRFGALYNPHHPLCSNQNHPTIQVGFPSTFFGESKGWLHRRRIGGGVATPPPNDFIAGECFIYNICIDIPRWFKVIFWSLSWRSLNLGKGHSIMPKRSQRIAMYIHVWSKYSDVTRPGPPKCSWGRREIRVGERLLFCQNMFY